MEAGVVTEAGVIMEDEEAMVEMAEMEDEMGTDGRLPRAGKGSMQEGLESLRRRRIHTQDDQNGA